MLTRLKVCGFKNLVDVDVRFGPFTCVAGPNGVGKSNLFDAIRFLSALADHTLMDAALSVREEGRRTSDVRSLFHRSGDHTVDQMSFEAEMIIPPEGADDSGQKATATITFLRYTLALGYRTDEAPSPQGTLEIRREELEPIRLGEAAKHILFPHKAKTWRASAIKGRRSSPFISTHGSGAECIVKKHQDGAGGRPLSRKAGELPRTVLSATNAAETPTALLARREMQSWRLLQLEPSALRRPDDFTAPSRLGPDGSHLAATLYRLARQGGLIGASAQGEKEPAEALYARVANRLAELIEDVRAIRVDHDEGRELNTLQVTSRDNTPHAARSLSDGTLRFLALSILAEDPEFRGVLCLEEPENGIHPARVPAMIDLLQDIATDTGEEVGPDNPLRQVIVNTHSPAVVCQVPDDCLLMALPIESVSEGRRYPGVRFACLPDTWRCNDDEANRPAPKGTLLDYLSPVLSEAEERTGRPPVSRRRGRTARVQRVADRPDVRQLLFPFEAEAPANRQ